MFCMREKKKEKAYQLYISERERERGGKQYVCLVASKQRTVHGSHTKATNITKAGAYDFQHLILGYNVDYSQVISLFDHYQPRP